MTNEIHNGTTLPKSSTASEQHDATKLPDTRSAEVQSNALPRAEDRTLAENLHSLPHQSWMEPNGTLPHALTGSTAAPPSPSSITLGDRTPSDKRLSAAPQNDRFGEYELIEEIARGGMGVVYKAKHLELNRIVALKMIRGGHLAREEEIRRFRSEAEAVAKLDHPSIIPIYDVGQLHGQQFFAMGYVDGGTLTQKVGNRPLPANEAAECLIKIADAIAYAHEHGVIHRDLKPDNVLLDKKGQPKLTDFGIAKLADDESNMTATGQVLGTPAYMSPEQAAGSKGDMSPLVDVYGLGAILYYLLTGKPPFQADNPIDIILRVLEREPVPPSKLNRSVPRILEKICLHAMEKSPRDRYPSARQLANDLRNYLMDVPVSLPKDSLWHRMQRWGRRRPLLAAHLGGILAIMTIAWTHKFVYGTELAYLLRFVYIFAVWAATLVGLQKWMETPRWRETARTVWGIADLILFTVVIYIVAPPRGPLMAGYAVLIACSGLFERYRYVWTMTIGSLIGMATITVIHRDDLWNPAPHYTLMVAACISIVGAAVGAMVKQLRMLRQYCDRDP